MLPLAVAALPRGARYALVADNGWYRAIDSSGRIVADSLFTGPEDLSGMHWGEELFPYQKGGKLGFKDARNRVVIPPAYKPAYAYPEHRDGGIPYLLTETRFRNGLAIVCGKSGLFGIVDYRGRLIADTVYHYIGRPDPATGNYSARMEDCLYILDRQGRNILNGDFRIDTQLYPCPRFSDGRLCVMKPDTSGMWSRFNHAYRGASRETAVRWLRPDAHRYKVGFADPSGRIVIPLMYRLATYMLDCGACESGRVHAGNSLGEDYGQWTLPSDWYLFQGERCLVSNGEDYFVINPEGDSLYACQEKMGNRNREGYISYADRSHSNYRLPEFVITRQGRRLPEDFSGPDFKHIGSGVMQAEVIRSGDAACPTTCFFTDSAGKAFPGLSFDHADAFKNTDGLIHISYYNDGHPWRLSFIIDETGRPPQRLPATDRFYQVGPARAGLAAYQATRSGPWGYLDLSGKVVIPPRYTEASAFQDSGDD